MSKSSSISNISVWHTKTVPFQTIQCSINTQFNSIWPIDRPVPSASALGEGGTGSNGIERFSALPKVPGLEAHY